ncbi:MAG: ABC transporter permease [Pirellulales bacterium]|nr:ABC transporter permease [Pirellulales bacterium]
MRKIFIVARREFIEMVKTKAFLFGVFLVPVIIGVFIFFSQRLQRQMVSGPQPTKTVAVADLSGELAAELEPLFQQHNESHADRQIFLELVQPGENGLEAQTNQMKERVRSRQLAGYLVIPKDVLEGNALHDGGRSQYYARGDSLADGKVFQTVRNLLNNAVVNRRCIHRGLSPQVIKDIRKYVPVDQMEVTAQQTKKQDAFPARMMVPFFFLFMMFAGMIGANQHLLTSVIEEKNSRVMEVILSSVSPMQFMAGKILGLVAVSLSTVFIWGLAAYAAAAYYGMADLVNCTNVGYFLVYFILGFLLFSSIFAAIGAACNTLKEAQSFMTPVMLIIVMPMVGWMYFSQNPNGFWSVVCSFIPPLTPMVMILRLAARPDIAPLQIFASIALLAASVPVVMWASAKIFRTGILMYGKPASLRELCRWVRNK